MKIVRNFLLVTLVFLVWLAGTGPVRSSEFVAFEPQDFVRETGAPTIVSVSVRVPDPELSYRLLIHNGGLDGQQQTVSIGYVLLNGDPIAGSAEFGGPVSVIEKPISLAADNTLIVILLGSPGATMTIEIRGDDSEAAEVTVEALAPTSPDGTLIKVFNSGWPLALRLSLARELGLTVLGQSAPEIGPFPRTDEWGLAVWEDPDGCLSWLDHRPNLDQPECRELQEMGPLPLDEVLMHKCFGMFDFS